MAYDPITAGEIVEGRPLDPRFLGKIKGNLDYIFGTLSSTGVVRVPNGSFDVDSDADGDPDSWIKTLHPGGSGTLYTTAPVHGEKAWSFTHPGGASNGGGYLDSDYIEMSYGFPYFLVWIIWATAAGMRNKIQIRYFDRAKAEVGSGSPADLYNSVSNPATPTPLAALFTPPADTCFAKIRIIGGYTDTDVAGTVYFDGVIMCPATVSIGGAAAANTLRTTTSASYAKLKEIMVPVSGVVTVAFTLEPSGGSDYGYGRVYVNGVAAGTERAVVTGTAETFSEDLTVLPGDKVQLYARKGGAIQVSVSDFSVGAPVYSIPWGSNLGDEGVGPIGEYIPGGSGEGGGDTPGPGDSDSDSPGGDATC